MTYEELGHAVRGIQQRLVTLALELFQLPESKGDGIRLTKLSELGAAEAVPRQLHADLPAPVEEIIPAGGEFAITDTDDPKTDADAFGFEGFTDPEPEGKPDSQSAADDLRSAFE